MKNQSLSNYVDLNRNRLDLPNTKLVIDINKNIYIYIAKKHWDIKQNRAFSMINLGLV